VEDVFKHNKYVQSRKKQLQLDAWSACDNNMSVVELISLCETITRSKIVCCGKDYDDDTQKNKRPKRGANGPRTQRVCWDCETGPLRKFTPKDSFWYQYYVSNPPTGTKKFNKKFHRRFCMSYKSY